MEGSLAFIARGEGINVMGVDVQTMVVSHAKIAKLRTF